MTQPRTLTHTRVDLLMIRALCLLIAFVCIYLGLKP